MRKFSWNGQDGDIRYNFGSIVEKEEGDGL